MKRIKERMPIKQALGVLGLPEISTLDDVKRAYRRKAKETHPDKNGTVESFIQVKAAYDALMEMGEHLLNNQLYPASVAQVNVYGDYVNVSTSTSTMVSEMFKNVQRMNRRDRVRCGVVREGVTRWQL